MATLCDAIQVKRTSWSYPPYKFQDFFDRLLGHPCKNQRDGKVTHAFSDACLCVVDWVQVHVLLKEI